MNYMLLIYIDENAQQEMKDDRVDMNDDYAAFTKWIADQGVLVSGDALQSVQTATTVRVRNGETLSTDGPYAETKEHLGGFYIVDAKDLDQAIDIASRIPGAREGSVEIRPILHFG
jgi:hypothetical protein